MKRNALLTAVKNTAVGMGYAFYTGHESVLHSKINSFPAMWLSPLELLKTEGRCERTDTYKISLNMIVEAPDAAGEEAESIWKVLENDAAVFYRSLAAHSEIRRVDKLAVMPNKKPLTRNGDFSVRVEFQADMFYYHEL